ncbi:MAG: FecR domain-containing protein [Cyanobacteria bacterium P01_F01_bin.116]
MEKLNIATTGRWLSLVGASLGMLLMTPRAASAQAALTWARVELIRNQVHLFTDGQSRRARVSDVLGINDALSTDRSARAELRFNDGSLARIGESAVFRFTPNTRNFRLSNGTVLLLIPPGQGRTTIQTPNATTGIHGSALFVRYVPETDTTIIGALTNNPDGPMMTFNEDGSCQQSLYAGELAVLDQNGCVEHFTFDMHEFIETSDLLADMNLKDPEASFGHQGLDAVRQEIQDALEQQPQFQGGEDVIENPAFLSANPNAPVSDSGAIQDFDISPAANFLQQENVTGGFESAVTGSVNQPSNPPTAARPPQPPELPTAPSTPSEPPVKPEIALPPQPEDPGPGVAPIIPEDTGQPVIPEPTLPEQPIDKPAPINQPVVIEQPAPAPAPTPEVVLAPEPPAVPEIVQPITKPTELPDFPLGPTENIPPEEILPPIDTVIDLEPDPQLDRLPDDVVVQGEPPPVPEDLPTGPEEPTTGGLDI